MLNVEEKLKQNMRLRYVQHGHIKKYEKAGWGVLKKLHGHHGEHAVLMCFIEENNNQVRIRNNNAK